MSADGIRLIDPEKTSEITKSDNSAEEQIDYDTFFGRENIHQFFRSIYRSDLDSIAPAKIDQNLASDIDYVISIKDKILKDYFVSTVLLMNNVKFALPKAYRNMNTKNRLDEIKLSIQNLDYRRPSEILSKIITYCRETDKLFPDFYKSGGEFKLGTSSDQSIDTEFHNFGTEFLFEMLDLNDFFASISTRFEPSKITAIKDEILAYYNGKETSIKTGQNIMAKLRSINYECFKISDFRSWSYWDDVLRETSTPIIRPATIFRFSAKFNTFEQTLSNLNQIFVKNSRYDPGRISGKSFTITEYYEFLCKFIGEGDANAILIERTKSRSETQIMKSIFGVRYAGGFHLQKSQLDAVDLLNQEFFVLCKLLTGGDGIAYANAWGEAMCNGIMDYNYYNKDKLPIKCVSDYYWTRLNYAHKLKGYDVSNLHEVMDGKRAFVKRVDLMTYVKRPFDTFVLDSDHLLRGVNWKERDAITSFLRKLESTGDISTHEITKGGKIYNIVGDSNCKSMGRTIMDLISTIDEMYAQKKKISGRELKGIIPDLAILLSVSKMINNGGSLKEIKFVDTGIVFEVIDYYGNIDTFYGRQKQFDAKAELQHGIPSVFIVEKAAYFSSFMEFPEGQDFIQGTGTAAARVEIPRVIGFNSPMITLIQVRGLGEVLKAEGLTYTDVSGSTVETKFMRFKDFLCHLDEIVLQNGDKLDSRLISVAMAEAIQAQFGIKDHEVQTMVSITRKYYRITPSRAIEEGVRTYSIDIRAFWQAVESADQSEITSMINSISGVSHFAASANDNILAQIIAVYLNHDLTFL